jgi:hypothetical protein
MLKIKKYVELDTKYVENRVIYVDFEGIYVENEAIYVDFMVNICWYKIQEGDISPLLFVCANPLYINVSPLA